ncbi:protein rolling stone-like [Ctenocephalides felis]|uniref:protein rolling stone-like n=1 Tax=Ctenocephalides felis TaxID=7515 RepID=UPI000E6E1DD5|nr:protein rolling stone-like [Ctenocephalides felis]
MPTKKKDKLRWQRSAKTSLYFLLYRLLHVLGCFFMLIISLGNIGRDTKPLHYHLKYPCYLTHWGIVLCDIQSVLALILVGRRLHLDRQFGNNAADRHLQNPVKMNCLTKTYWLTNTLATVSSIIITCCYWSLIFDANRCRAKKLAELLYINLHPDLTADLLDPRLEETTCEDDSLDFITVTIHIFNFILMMIDFIVVAHPFRFLHIFWSMLMAAVYELFSWVYFMAGGTGRELLPFLYPTLDWRKPFISLGYCAVGILTYAMVHILVFFMSWTKRKLYIKIVQPPSPNPIQSSLLSINAMI